MSGFSRRTMLAGGAAAGALGPSALGAAAQAGVSPPRRGERWGVIEIALDGPRDWEASTRAPLTATFALGDRSQTVAGFWDGAGRYRVRFMPDEIGEWRWTTRSDVPSLARHGGAVTVSAPRPGNRGPVRVANMYHFAYADGTPYRELGATSYAWQHQPEARCAETLRALAASPFNKLRMAVFPNGSVHTEPVFPFAQAGAGWDFTHFNPAFFQNLERRVAELGALGIEADIILFHPYDEARGFSAMSRAQDEIYLRYLIARLAAYRNVWWSMANEWDLVKSKSEGDFDHIFQTVRDADPYNRLRSIHQWRQLYDHNKPWVTHASIQNGAALEDDARALLYRDAYRKPIVFDEVRYEGDIAARWGNLSPQLMLRAFWEAHLAGCYCGYGEAYQPDLWMGVGGALHGQSIRRLAFLKEVMAEGPAEIDPIDRWWGRHIAGKAGQYYLRYFGEEAPLYWQIDLPKDELSGGERFRVDTLDTWNMGVGTLEGGVTLAQTGPYSFGETGRHPIALPGVPWMAVRLTRLT